MDFISFRAGITFALALILAMALGGTVIRRLQKMQIGEEVRNLGLEGQMQKRGTPTMGGIIIIFSILLPCLLLGNLSNIYMILMLVATVWMGTIGALDDYRKLKYHNKEGLAGKYKVIGQIGLGLIVGITMWLSPDIVMSANSEILDANSHVAEVVHSTMLEKTPQTTIPFVKNNNFNYEWLTSWISDPQAAETLGWIVFVAVVIFVVTAVSNGANLTDGLDGLCAGTSAIICVALAIMAYLGGNVIYSTYLNIMYIPQSSELVVFMSAFIGALIGFLWYNAYPAQVFMGDTGSLFLGGAVCGLAFALDVPLVLIPVGIIYIAETLSDIIQVLYFKATHGKRFFRMAPLHHHFEMGGWSEVKIVLVFAAITVAGCVLAWFGVMGR